MSPEAEKWKEVALRLRDAVAGAVELMEEDAADMRKLRELLWLRHGCVGLYGDDGEMQCGACLLDFKRAELLSRELERGHRYRNVLAGIGREFHAKREAIYAVRNASFAAEVAQACWGWVRKPPAGPFTAKLLYLQKTEQGQRFRQPRPIHPWRRDYALARLPQYTRALTLGPPFLTRTCVP